MDITLPLEGWNGGMTAGPSPEASRMLDPVAWETIAVRAAKGPPERCDSGRADDRRLVALWRPVELLLYDPWILRRDIRLYRRLETADVSVSPAGSGSGARWGCDPPGRRSAEGALLRRQPPAAVDDKH
jgi:hypothetical protein